MPDLGANEGEYYATVGKRCDCDACPREIAPYVCQDTCGCEEDCDSCALQCHEIEDQEGLEDEE